MTKFLVVSVLYFVLMLDSALAETKSRPLIPISDFRFQASDGSILIEDGGSFWVGSHRVRLFGVDTIEKGQICTAQNRSVDCHAETIKLVEPLIKSSSLVCQPLMGKTRNFGCTAVDTFRFAP